MTYMIGINPGQKYSSDDIVKGNGPGAGTHGKTADGKEYVMCVIAAAQNLLNGHLVTIDAAFAATIAAAGPPGPNAAQRLGVVRLGSSVIATVTASASEYVWVQIFGVGSVLATASTLPNVTLTMSAAAGTVDDAVATASGVIDGLVLTATTAASGITAAILTYPRFTTPGQPG